MRLPGSARLHADGALTLRRHPSEVVRGRRHVAAACRGYDAEVADTAVLLTSELITNALRHGAGAITLLVTPVPGGVRVDVADESPLAPRAGRAGSTDENGRGMFIVERLATTWGMDALPQGRGKAVWFTLSVR